MPVVALNDKMGVAFQVQDEHDGLLLSTGEAELEALGTAMAQLLGDTARRRLMGLRASTRARERVSPDAIYARYEDAYAQAIAHRDANPPPVFRPFSALPWRGLIDRHVGPWTSLQVLLFTLGMMRRGTKNYTVPRDLQIDALPGVHAVPPPAHMRMPTPRPVRDPYPMRAFG